MPTHPSSPAPSLARPRSGLDPFVHSTEQLVIALRFEAEGPVVHREPVRSADLIPLLSEAWRDGCLRRGHPEVALGDLEVTVEPRRRSPTRTSCLGFNLAIALPSGDRVTLEFSLRSLVAVARRAAAPYIASRQLQPGRSYFYEIEVEPASPPASAPPADAPGPAFTLRVQSPALTYLHLPLRPLLQRARPVGDTPDGVFPVFYTAEALARANEYARRGADANPPVESGGALIGSLASCPESGELFALITDALEIEAATQAPTELTYSAQSWNRLDRILSARQKAHPELAQRLLGQCHGHNFLPQDGKTCDGCDQRSSCTMTSAFASEDDETWTRAVFTRQPWALCHVFGLTARNEPVDRLFSFCDGRLQERGYAVLPDAPTPDVYAATPTQVPTRIEAEASAES